MKQFKKLALVSAIAAMGTTGTASAITLGTLGEGLLIPYVVCDESTEGGRTNTMIGVITHSNVRFSGLEQDDDGEWVVNPQKLIDAKPSHAPGDPTVLRWRFYDERSVHRIDSFITVTDNDYLAIDWCSTIQERVTPAQFENQFNGVPGYLILVDDAVKVPSASQGADFDFSVNSDVMRLSGHAYQIRGNWGSQAFVPVVPVPHQHLGESAGVEKGNYLRINRLVNGIDFDRRGHVDATGLSGNIATSRMVTLRYFLDPPLSQGNDIVFWFNRNDERRARTSAWSFDADQTFRNSFDVDLTNQLNIHNLTYEDPGRYLGVRHESGDLANTGLIQYYVPTFDLSKEDVPKGAWDPSLGTDGDYVGGLSGGFTGTRFRYSGLAFNMLRMGGSNDFQLQTELALEGRWATGGF